MRDAIKNAKRIVVKVGSSTLCYPNGHLNLERIEHLVRQLSDLANQGKEVILVSSGATGAGLAPLGFKEKPRDLVLRQASAAVGQGVLIQLHVIPIINENDVVAIEEYKIGDNDTLSATVAGIVEADVLIILSDIDGLYTANPATNPEATLIHEVSMITDETYKIAGGAGSSMGTGGMYTKIKAAHMATNSGIHMIITSGESDNSLRRVCNGEDIGTLFIANDQGVSQKHHWVAYGKRLSGFITIDNGCASAVLDKGASILPAGIISVDGIFEPGDTVSILYDGKEIARGLVNYSSSDLVKIKGHNTQDIARVLEINTTYDEVIHRNNLVIIH